MFWCVVGVKRGESEHCANAIKWSQARRLTHTIAVVTMHQKCAAAVESVFVGSVFVVRASKSPTMLTMGSSVNAVISAATSTEDCCVEVRATHR